MALVIPDNLFGVLTIWQEARGEVHEGRVAVGEVIRNRIKRKFFSDGSVAGTVLKPYQFSGWNTTDHNRIAAVKLDDSSPIFLECQAAWEESSSTNLTNGAILYYNPKGVKETPNWVSKSTFTTQIGNHLFYTV